MKKKKKLKRILVIVAFALLLSSMTVTTVMAEDTVVANDSSAFGKLDDFESLGKDNMAHYFGSKYKTNYYLDITSDVEPIKKIGKKLLNDLANILWNLSAGIGNITCSLVYWAMSSQLSTLIGKNIDAFQEHMINGMFTQLYTVAVAFMGVLLLIKLFKKDIVGSYKEIAKAVFIFVIAMAVSTNSGRVLNASADLTTSISQAVFVAINDQSGTDNETYAVTATGALWNDMVHTPWLSMEFGTTAGDNINNYAEELLSMQRGSERSKKADEINDKDDVKECFGEDVGGARVGMAALYLIPCVMKAFVFIAVSLLKVALELIAILVIMMAPIVLLLSLIPGFEFDLLSRWIRYFMTVHVYIIILQMILAFLTWIDQIMYDNFGDLLGWMGICFLQAIIAIIIFLSREKILAFFTNKPTAEKVRIMEQKSLDLTQQGVETISNSVDQIHAWMMDTPGWSAGRYDPDTERERTGTNAYHVPDYGEDVEESDEPISYQETNTEDQEEQAGYHNNTIDMDYQGPGMQTNRVRYEDLQNAPSEQQMYDVFKDEAINFAAPEESGSANTEKPIAGTESYQSIDYGNTRPDNMIDFAATEESGSANTEKPIAGTESYQSIDYGNVRPDNTTDFQDFQFGEGQDPETKEQYDPESVDVEETEDPQKQAE